MKKLILILFHLGIFQIAFAQKQWAEVNKDIQEARSVDTLKNEKYSLIYIDKTKDFDSTVKKNLIDVYFKTYAQLVKKFNKHAKKQLIFVMDPDYDGIAATAGGVIRFNPEWFKKNPGDIDIVTHEGMHVVQDYPNGSGPGWITEGIADYVRFVYGVDNAGANWTLPNVKPDHHYSSSYRITARFFYWIEKKVKKGTIVKLDKAMRTKSYQESFWKENTGKSIDELWLDYTKDPAI